MKKAGMDGKQAKTLETCPWCGGKASPMKEYPFNYNYAQCMAYLHDWTSHTIWNCGEPDIGCRWVPAQNQYVLKSGLKRKGLAWISWSETKKPYPMVTMVPAKKRKPRSKAERLAQALIWALPSSSMSKERGKYMEVHVRMSRIPGTVRVQFNSLHGPGKILVSCREGKFLGDYDMDESALVAVVTGFLHQIKNSKKKREKSTEVVWG